MSWSSLLLSDWQRRLTVLFTGLFLYQFVLWFSEEPYMWLPTTTMLVKFTMLFTLLAELLPGRNRIALRLVQFLLLVAFNAVALDFHPVSGSLSSAEGIRKLVLDNVSQLLPYFWFSMGAWLIYLFALWWVKAKPRVYAMMVIGLLMIAVRDSFSPVILWDNAAIVILSGLFLIVIRQFSDLKRKNPSGWAYFSDYPVSIALPIVFLLVITVGVGVLAPDVGNVLKDPYTLWMNWKGEPVLINGKGKLPDLPVLKAQGSAASGYSRGDQALGGGFDFDYTPVMTIESTHRSYWRGETRSLYTGKGWEKSGVEKAATASRVGGPEAELPEDTRLPAGQMKTVEVRQTVTLLTEEPFPVLFGALAPQRVESLGEGTGYERLTWAARSAELRWDTRTRGSSRDPYPETYTVVSQMPVIDEAGLRTVPADLPNRSALEDYLQLPNNLPERVVQLAKDITKSGATPYDKVKLLENYLQTNYRYTNQPNDKGKTGGDFVDRFLFETKEGYCDYFSTAMAILTRSIGMPARWVKGYATGTSEMPDIPSQITSSLSEGPNTYTVRNADAHSWVEVYFPGWGWMPFEATSGYTAPVAVAPQEAAPQEESAVTETPEETVAVATEAGSFPVRTLAWTAAAVLLAAAAAYVLFRFRRKAQAAREALSLNQQVVTEYNGLVKYLKRKGFPVLEHETARETVNRWIRKDTWLRKELEQLLQLFEKAKYSPQPVTPDEASRASFIIRKLRESYK